MNNHKKTLLVLLLILSAVTFALIHPIAQSSPTTSAEYDKTSERISFAISHGHCNLGFHGLLESVSIDYSEGEVESLKINFDINTASLKVEEDGGPLTNGLHSRSMFNGDGNHYISFRTVDIFRLGDDWFQLRGKMSIKGIERTVRLRTTPVYQGNQISQYVIDGTIDLHEFGIASESEDNPVVGQIMYLNLVLQNSDSKLTH